MPAARLLVLWCPEWPVIAAVRAAGAPVAGPAAVCAANLVVSCNAPARAEGVRVGARRREAQGRCPELLVLPDDPARDARLFDPVVAAVEELVAGVEVVRPGEVAVVARGLRRHFGSVGAAAAALVDRVAARTGVECRAGVAEGLFAAALAARRGVVVAPGGAAGFLAPLDVRVFGPTHPELVDLLRRLGIGTVGVFAALAPDQVAARFGADAARAHRLARGMEERPPVRHPPRVDLSVVERPDPPLDRVDAAAFLARAMAERLHAALAARGLACTRLAVRAVAADGAELLRTWRCAEPLTPAGVADRVRWQLDGWLSGPRRPAAGIAELRLDPVGTVAVGALRRGLWQGAPDERAERAARAAVHVQGLLGPDGVLLPVLGGGRGPADRVRLVPWGDERAPGAAVDQPWPGRLPGPSPALVPVRPLPARVLDRDGAEVGVTGRFRLTAPPAAVAVARDPPRRVAAWAGPWPADERWWDPVAARRRSRLQVLLHQKSEEDVRDALLLLRENEKWSVEGVYD